MEHPRPESQLATPDEAYEQDHAEVVDVMGYLQARIAAKYRNDRPRSSEHIGEQEELLAMLRDVVDFLGA